MGGNFRTPQEKKSLSYARDRRNSYGESDKGSRRSIKRNKIKPSRAYRRHINQLLQSEISASDFEGVDLLNGKLRNVERRKWKKWPDAPLGVVVRGSVEKRFGTEEVQLPLAKYMYQIFKGKRGQAVMLSRRNEVEWRAWKNSIENKGDDSK